MNEHEVALLKAMIALIARYPDGLERIQSAFECVVEAGHEMVNELN